MLLALTYGGREIYLRWTHVYEYDARVSADIVTVSSRADGWIVEMPALEGARVKGGETVVRIDDRIAKLRVDALKAQIEGIRSERARLKAERAFSREQVETAIKTRTSGVAVREKAREAVESVHAARDTGRLSWPNIRNVADVDQFLDTTVTFPLSVAKGLAQGVEARIDVPLFRDINGYVSLSRAKILLTAPLTGGLFLGDVPAPGEQFYADHDQRWQSQFGASYTHPSRRVYVSMSGRYDSGIPFELPADFNAATFPDQKALTLVNSETGRAKARTLVDVMVGSQLYRNGRTNVDAQVGLSNAFNTTYCVYWIPALAPEGALGRNDDLLLFRLEKTGGDGQGTGGPVAHKNDAAGEALHRSTGPSDAPCHSSGRAP